MNTKYTSDGPLAIVQKAFSEQSFATLDEANAFLSSARDVYNAQPLPDFQGLSPVQMHSLRTSPFDAPDIVQFPDVLAAQPVAPIISLFTLLIEGIGNEGIKTTATGNLPRQLCRDIALAHMGTDAYKEFTSVGGINTELDYFDLHIVRNIAQGAKLLRVAKGQMALTKLCRKLWDNHGAAGIYPLLFKTYAQSYNWGYRDQKAAFPTIQDCFAYSLYLLHRAGDATQPTHWYEDAFLQAFPHVLNEMEPVMWTTPEKLFRIVYTDRTMKRFAAFFGLVDLAMGIEGKGIEVPVGVTRLPLFGDVLKFVSA